MQLINRFGVSTSIALQRRNVRLVLNSESRAAGKALVRRSSFFGELQVGVPAQSFSVVFDTGSGNLVIPGDGCSSEACLAHRRFHPASSTSNRRVPCRDAPEDQENDHDLISITFGTGEVWGACYENQICIGSACYSGPFIATTFESQNPFLLFSFDGILGLSLPSLSQTPQFNVMQRMWDRRSLHSPVFTVFLSEEDDMPSEVTFGIIKAQSYESELLWVPVVRDHGYWEVRINDITLNEVGVGACTGCYAAADTGTSELAGPNDVISRLASKLNVQPDCSNMKSLPRLGFIVSGRVLNLEPTDYVNEDDGVCSLALMPLDVPPPMGPIFVFGVPFLQRIFTAYDVVNRQIGFGVARRKTGRSNLTMTTVAPPAPAATGAVF